MKKILSSLALILTLALIAAACNFIPNQSKNLNLNQNQNTNNLQTNLSFLTSKDEYIKYCNGADMDSEGFRKTITKTITITIPAINLSREELIKQSVVAASEQAQLDTAISIDQNFLKIVGDTAYIRPIEGWAGVSIFLCAWKPLVEVNLLRFPEIKKVEWLNDPAKWAELNK
jgi:hypothetical protein